VHRGNEIIVDGGIQKEVHGLQVGDQLMEIGDIFILKVGIYMAIQTTVEGCYVNDNGEWVDDSNFKVKALNAEQLVRQKYYPDNAAAHTRCSGFDGSKWTIRVYEDNEFKTTNIGWYYVDINTGKITNMV